MTQKYNFILILVLFISMLVSCSKEDKTEFLIEDKLATMSAKEMILDMLLRNGNDTVQLARIFECSPSSLKRIISGVTQATPQAENQFKKVLKQALITNNKSFKDLDPYYKSDWKLFTEQHWGKAIILSISSLIIIFLQIIVLDEMKSKHRFYNYLIYILSIIVILTVIVMFIGYILIRIYMLLKGFSSEPILIDNFQNTIDPIWETL
jgi:hypothetical protein